MGTRLKTKMADAGFFKGTNADQDSRFANKNKKLMKTMKFAPGVEKKVDMTKVNLDTIKPWISSRVTSLLGLEDEVLIEIIYNQLEDRYPSGKDVQVNCTGFLNARNARIFVEELWELLCSAQENIGGIPTKFIQEKKEEIKRRQAEKERIESQLKREEEKSKERERHSSRDRSRKDRRDRSRSRSRDRSRRRRFREKSPSKSPRLRPSR